MKVIYHSKWLIVTRWLYSVRLRAYLQRVYHYAPDANYPALRIHAGRYSVAVRLWF